MESKTYTRNAHSICCLTYHAVFVIKYRRKVITPEILAFMRNHTDYLISQRYHGKLLEFNGEEDHIHILFELPPSAVNYYLQSKNTTFKRSAKTILGTDL